MNKNLETVKATVIAAFTAYTQACATLADVISNALKAGATREQIVEWASTVSSPSHVSRLLCEMGVRVRGKRADAGKKRSTKEADEAVTELMTILGDVFAETAEEGEASEGAAGKKPTFSLEKTAKRINDHCKGNKKKIVAIMGTLQRAVLKLASK